LLKLADINIVITKDDEIEARTLVLDIIANRKEEITISLSEHANMIEEGFDEHANSAKGNMAEHSDQLKIGMVEHAYQIKEGVSEHGDQIKEEVTQHSDQIKEEVTKHADQIKDGVTEHSKQINARMNEHANHMKQNFDDHAKTVKEELVTLSDLASVHSKSIQTTLCSIQAKLNDRQQIFNSVMHSFSEVSSFLTLFFVCDSYSLQRRRTVTHCKFLQRM